MRKTSTNQTRRWPSAISSFLLLHASFANPVDDTGNNNFQRLFMDCDVDTYYESVRDLDNGGWINTETSSSSFQQEDIRTLLSLLLHKTHRQMLSTDSFDSRSFVPDPSTADMNTAQALQFLDAGTERPNTVQIIFTQTEMEADALGMGGGWEPGYLWDIRGVVAAEEENETTAFAESDLHNLRPRHVNLNNDAALQGLFYGNCYQCYQEDKAGSDDSNILFHDGTRALAAAGRDRIGSTNGGSTSSTTSNNMRSTQNSRSSNSNNSNNDPLCLCPNEQALQPPVEARGEIARALLYMELRYGIPTTASDGLGLSLSDCPPQNNSTNNSNSYNMQRMGYFSRLVQWHLEYPPTEREIQRNDAICQYYQGNRNPFVDFPEDSWSLLPFATVDGEECPTSNDETVEEDKSLVDESTEQGVTTPEQDVVVVDEDAPTESETKEDSSTTTTTDGRLEDSTHPCDDFMAGDINFNMIDQSTSAFGLVALIDVPENMELFVTSNPWDAATSTFDASEGSTIKLVSPGGGIQPAGKPFGYGDLQYLGDQWTLVSDAAFSISDSGAELYLYCENESGSMNAIAAISTTGKDFVALPTPLSPYGYGVIVLPADAMESRYRYVGPAIHDADLYAKALISVANWDRVDSSSTASSVTTEDYGIGNNGSGNDSNNSGNKDEEGAIEILPPRQSLGAPVRRDHSMSGMLVAVIFSYLLMAS